MKRLFKKLVACVAAGSMIATMGLTAFAHTEMENMVFAGYDTANPENPMAIYNEVINGSYTNKHVFVPVEPEWRNDGCFEDVYPYAGYDTMYLEGNKTKINRYNNLFPQWETRRQDFFWEVKKPHIIWERQQTNVPTKGWTWDYGNKKFSIPEEAVLTRTIREAVVVNEEMLPYGFGWYNNQGEILGEKEQNMYKQFAVTYLENGVSKIGTVYDVAVDTWAKELTPHQYDANGEYFYNENAALSWQNLSVRDADTGLYVLSDEEISELIPVVYSNYITAKFTKDSNYGLSTKNVALEYLTHGEDWEWDKGADESFTVAPCVDIAWTAPTYEMAEPYDQYQYLIVNGIVLDGKDGKDKILRYTGGKANPEITWKFEFFQVSNVPTAAGAQPFEVLVEVDEEGNYVKDINPEYTVFELVERKYVDGVPAVDADGNPVYRIPTGVYGNTFFKVTDENVIELYVTADGHTILLGQVPNWEGTLAAFIDAYISGSINLVTGVEADQTGVFLD